MIPTSPDLQKTSLPDKRRRTYQLEDATIATVTYTEGQSTCARQSSDIRHSGLDDDGIQPIRFIANDAAGRIGLRPWSSEQTWDVCHKASRGLNCRYGVKRRLSSGNPYQKFGADSWIMATNMIDRGEARRHSTRPAAPARGNHTCNRGGRNPLSFFLGLVKSSNKAKARKELEQLLSKGKMFSRTEEAKALLKQLL